jgi:hypothetical protein
MTLATQLRTFRDVSHQANVLLDGMIIKIIEGRRMETLSLRGDLFELPNQTIRQENCITPTLSTRVIHYVVLRVR